MRNGLNLIFAMLISLLPLACSPGSASAPKHEVQKVLIRGFKFQPQELTVNIGDTVEFSNADMLPHNAVAEGKFDSGKLQPGKAWQFSAKEKGTFDYICTLHPNMKGRLTVR